MTTANLIDTVSLVFPDAYQTGRTCRAAHGVDLANLSNLAALGHPSQVLSYGKLVDEGTYSLYYKPLQNVVKYLVFSGLLTWGTHDTGATANVALTFRDMSGNSVGAGAPLDGSFEFRPGRDSSARDSATQVQGIVSVDNLITAGLDPNDDSWRVEVVVNYSAPYVFLDGVTVFELPRRMVSTTEPFGTVPGAFLPLQPIMDVGQVQEVLKGLEGAFSSSLRTYLCLSVSEENGALYATQGDSDGSLDNLEEAGTTPITFYCRPRYLNGTTSRFQWQVRYRVNGDDAQVTMTTSAGVYYINLGDTGGVWTDSSVGTGYFSCTGPGSVDSMTITGSDVDPVCEVSAITVWEYPEV